MTYHAVTSALVKLEKIPGMGGWRTLQRTQNPTTSGAGAVLCVWSLLEGALGIGPGEETPRKRPTLLGELHPPNVQLIAGPNFCDFFENSLLKTASLSCSRQVAAW